MRSIGVNFQKERCEIIFVINKADRITNLAQELQDHILSDNLYQKIKNPGVNAPIGSKEIKIYL
jgi:hypothetical protein